MHAIAQFGFRQLALKRSYSITAQKRFTLHRTMASANQADSNSYHVLQYQYVPDILEKRGPYRAQHLDGAKQMADQNKLVMAGALTDPVDGAIFIFRNSSKEDIEAFVKRDPYVVNNLVPSYTIRPYMVVAGDRD